MKSQRRKRETVDAAKNQQQDNTTTTERTYFYSNNDSPFPTEVDSQNFPAIPYATRRGAVKSIIHHGQRKLLLSEMQLLIEALENAGVVNNSNNANNNKQKFTIVYPGSAPGTHLPYLDKLFPGHEWILIDPIRFNSKFYCEQQNSNNNNNSNTDEENNNSSISSSNSKVVYPNFRLINGYFTAETALSLVGERLIHQNCNKPYFARVLTHAATKGEYCEVFPLNERVQQAEEGANLIKGVQSVDADESASTTNNNLADNISSFLRNRSLGLNLLLDAMTERSSQQQQGQSSSSSSSSSSSELLFISDIRSGTSTLTDDVTDPDKLSAEFEQHIINDMRVQMEWVEMIRPKYSILKFRLPYMEVYDPISKKIVHRHTHTHTEYLSGKVLLPIWTRPTSTECRLLVPRGARRIQYDNRKFENQMFFFNTVLRENVHFNHLIENNRGSFLDHRYDGAAEVNLLMRYLKIMQPQLFHHHQEGNNNNDDDESHQKQRSHQKLEQEILRLSKEISDHSGKSFEYAANRLNELALEKAKARGFLEVQQRIVKKCEEKRASEVWWKNHQSSGENNAGGDNKSSSSSGMWSWFYSAAEQ